MQYSAIPGWMDFEPLYDKIVQDAPHGATLVEIGCWFGRSLVYLGQQAKRANKGLLVHGVDHGQGDTGTGKPPQHLIGTLIENLTECKLLGFVRIMNMDSVQAARWFEDKSVYFAFIDADHKYESVLADIQAWRPKIMPGGILAGHDIGLKYVERAVWEEFGEAYEICDVAPTCWMVKL